MTLHASIGIAQALDGHEAGLQAAHQALNQHEAEVPRLALVIASHQYQPSQLSEGLSSLLGNVPIIGFSSPAGLSNAGQHPHSVVLALLSGDFVAESHWLAGYAESGRETAIKLGQLTATEADEQTLLLFADGFNGDADQFCSAIPAGFLSIAGALSSGDLYSGSTYLLAGDQAGSGGLAAALIRGNLRIGIGYGHGWAPVGSLFRVTRTRGFWLRTLDGHPASETYAQLFGQPARDWAFPPLNYLARLYPLGMEQGEDLVLRAPIRVEADGSFRMNAPVREGVDAQLLVGSRSGCEAAARQAAQQALAQLGDARPAFALVLADIAWQMLFKAQAGSEVSAVQDILGANLPIAGGYTLGQIVPGAEGAGPRFLNQHILVLVFGENAE